MASSAYRCLHIAVWTLTELFSFLNQLLGGYRSSFGQVVQNLHQMMEASINLNKKELDIRFVPNVYYMKQNYYPKRS